MQKQNILKTPLPPPLATTNVPANRVNVAHTTSEQSSLHTWSIVLAGGEGERLRALTKRWLGGHRPKQYCAFVGQRSMLQHTLDRAIVLSGTDRTLVVVARQHAPEVWDHLDIIHWEQTILQPRNCGTAPGIFLPLAHIYMKDPEAIVLILPSDHFVFPEAGFLTALQRVVATAHRLPDKLVLLGAHADCPETEYGWILPGSIVDQVDGHIVRTVESFREKPNRPAAETLLAAGGLWNTMVMAARVKTLWKLGEHFPTMMKAFESLTHYLGNERESQMLDSIYETMPDINFSSHLVENIPAATVVIELRDVVWSDWGNEERITETLGRIGKTPLFTKPLVVPAVSPGLRTGSDSESKLARREQPGRVAVERHWPTP
jgi:mannose-1-phosphate guanylyltransferase